MVKTKKNLKELSILGGPPTFKKKLHVGCPNIGDHQNFFERIKDIFERRWLTNNGYYVQSFEKEVCNLLGVKNCIAICNGTIALEIAIKALGLSGEVIVPSFTFIATAHALQWQGLTPVFCDINPNNHSIDPKKVEELITPQTTGIIGVHLWGNPCEIEILEKIAKNNGLKLIFDAAHAFGCSYNGRMIGNFGNAEVFSFHATKFFNTLEGGAVVTNDDKVAKKIRLMRNFGFSGYDKVDYIGTNGKMNEISAAMGLTNLESMDVFIKLNLKNYKNYKERLSDLPGLKVYNYNEKEKCNYQYLVLEIDKKVTKITRDQLIKVLYCENVLARRYFYPGCHRMEPYRSLYPQYNNSLPGTEEIADRILLLPTGTTIGSYDIEVICDIIQISIENYKTLFPFLEHPN